MSFSISRSLLKLTSVESELPSNHLILCRPLLFLPSVFPSVQLFLLRAHSPAGGPSAACRGCTWTFVDLWAPSQRVGHHQCLLPSAFSRRRHSLTEVKLMAWGRTAVSGENPCWMEAFLLQRLSSLQRLGNSPSTGLPAAPSPTQRARGAATQMALCSVCLLMVNTQLFAGTCIILLKQLVAQQTLGTRRLHTPRLQFFPGDPRKCVNFEVAQTELDLLLRCVGSRHCGEWGPLHTVLKLTRWFSSQLPELVSLAFTYVNIHTILRMQHFKILRSYYSPAVHRVLWHPALFLIAQEVVWLRSDSLNHGL